MLTEFEVVSADKMKLTEPYALYYLSEEGDQVIRMNLIDSDSKQTISEATANHRNDRLFARPGEDSLFDLYVYLESEDRGAETESMILDNFSEHAPIEWRIVEGYSEKPVGSGSNYGPVPAIGTESDWKFRTGYWPIEGIRGKNEKTGQTVYYALELPFVAWPVRNATQLSGGYVVAQLGDDQICLMNLESGKIALIARGKGPIAVKQ